MKLLLDMNLSPRWVATLRNAGFEAEHWSSIGAANAPDTEILAYARSHNLVLLTHDLDFSAILAASGDRTPSVVQIRSQDITPDGIASQVVAAIRQTAEELASGALVTVDANRARIRILPLVRS